MNYLYLKDDLNWDLTMYLSRVSIESNKISDNINKLINCLIGIKEKADQEELKDFELISESVIPEELAKAFVKTMNNLQNEVFYNSLFLITTAFLESSLTELCRIIGPYLKNPICHYPQYNKKENGINKANSYLKDTLTINICHNNKWSIFQENAKIRNVIIHNSGNIIKDYEKGIKQ